MIIDQLPAASSVDPTDELPIEKGQLTYKATVSQLVGDLIKVTHSVNTGTITVPANDIYSGTITVNDAKYGIIKGFAIGANTRMSVLYLYFSAPNTIRYRIDSRWSSPATCNFQVYYC